MDKTVYYGPHQVNLRSKIIQTSLLQLVRSRWLTFHFLLGWFFLFFFQLIQSNSQPFFNTLKKFNLSQLLSISLLSLLNQSTNRENCSIVESYFMANLKFETTLDCCILDNILSSTYLKSEIMQWCHHYRIETVGRIRLSISRTFTAMLMN